MSLQPVSEGQERMIAEDAAIFAASGEWWEDSTHGFDWETVILDPAPPSMIAQSWGVSGFEAGARWGLAAAEGRIKALEATLDTVATTAEVPWADDSRASALAHIARLARAVLSQKEQVDDHRE